MSIQWLDNKRTEIRGLNYVQKVVNDAGSIFNKIDGTTDIGLDGYIEFIKDNHPTGLCIGIQIKSGNSNLSGVDNEITLKADKNHFEYWYNHILPIIAIVYIPQNEQAYWVDISQYLADDEEKIERGPFTIKIDKENIFDVKTFNLFHYQLTKYLSSYGNDKFFGRSLKFLADYQHPESRFEAIKSLVSFHRNKMETWFYLISHFCFEEDHNVQLAFIYSYRHLLSHGDIWWHPGNILDDNIRKQANQLISRYFNNAEVSKLVSHINDNGISRGSVGYDVNLIIRLIPNRIDYLKKIILNVETTDEKRFWAAVCLINEFQSYDLKRAIHFAESMMSNFPNSEYGDRFESIRDTLIEFENIDFTG
ncbi:DUF4365 domain-containing protein [Sphingobacterium spiritivorum]|uniref:DUF4365 domain-containing protein n=1 Tax=Sphingobacterium spiritivorum TaxID=258 RepID=UPI003DA334DB